MAFPPNYGQERNNREKAKQRKALEKQQQRQDKSAQRKHEPEDQNTPADQPIEQKDI